MIIDKSPIDKDGKFIFDIGYLPNEDNLFRIHISKKSDPVASLIIGGKDENHFFLIANNNSNLLIKDTCDQQFIKCIKIEGYYPNQILQKINKISYYLDSTSYFDSPVKNELIRSAIYEELRSYADTCTNLLVCLYALYKSNFEKNYPINKQYYKDFLSRWIHEQSPYLTEFKRKIPDIKEYKAEMSILIGLLSFIFGSILSISIFKLLKKNKNPLYDLSLQERKIFTLIMNGKSNKEISDELNIGLSTVKSHVNRIYSKLEIKSRKDILNLNIENPVVNNEKNNL
jgi:DNA-binding CsgD family transcriptional regulator